MVPVVLPITQPFRRPPILPSDAAKVMHVGISPRRVAADLTALGGIM